MNRIGWTLTALTSAIIMTIAGAGIAEAGLRQFQEGFEANPAAVWHIQKYGSGNAGYDYNNGGTPRSERGNGWLHSGYSAGGGAAEGIWVYTGSSGFSRCTAQMYVNPLNDRSREITVEAFNSANTRIAYGERLLAYAGYQAVTLDFELWGYQRVYVRYALHDSGRGHDGEWARLDDFTLTCTW